MSFEITDDAKYYMTTFGVLTFVLSVASYLVRSLVPIINAQWKKFGGTLLWEEPKLYTAHNPDNPFGSAGPYFRLVMLIVDGVMMWTVLAWTCGSIMYLGIAHWIIDNPVTCTDNATPHVHNQVNMYNLFYYSYAIALVPLLGMINARTLSIFSAPRKEDRSQGYPSVPEAMFDLVVGNGDEASIEPFSARSYLFYYGFIFAMQATDGHESNFYKRFPLVIFVGACGAVLVVAFSCGLLAWNKNRTIGEITGIYRFVAGTALTVTSLFLSIKMMYLNGEWSDLISGEIGRRTEFLVVCTVVPGFIIFAVLLMAIVRASRR